MHHNYIPMSTVQYRRNSLEGVIDNNGPKQYYSIYPKSKDPYSKKKEFLESCNNSKYLNKKGNITRIAEVINNIFENGTDGQISETVSFINYEILPKIRDQSIFLNSINVSNIKESYKNSIDDHVKVYNECDRVINNDCKLNNRFNLDKYIQENTHRSSDKLIRSLCEMIDTYNISFNRKYNIALESVQYALYKNGQYFDNTIKEITDYFLLREAILNDVDSRNMNFTIQNNVFLDPERISRMKMTKMDIRVKYIDKIEFIRNHKIDNERTGKMLDMLADISTESQASDYIKLIYDSIIKDGTLTDNDKEILKNSINMIPLISPIDKNFITYELNKLDGALLSTRDLLETVSFINEMIKDTGDIFGKYYKPAYGILESYDSISCSNIHDYIEEFKLNQDKSPERFIKLLSNIVPLNNNMCESIVKELPAILYIIKALYIDKEYMFEPFKEFIYSLIYSDIDPTTCNTMKNILKSEYDDLYKIDNNTYKPWLDTLNNCIKKINMYLDAVTKYPFNEEAIQDVELSFEESVVLIENMFTGINNLDKMNKEELLSSIADNIRLFTTNSDNLRDLTNVLLVSKVVDKQEYGNLLKDRIDTTEDNAEKLIISNEFHYINTFKLDTDIISESLLIMEANQLLMESFCDEIIVEATGKPTVKKKKKGLDFTNIQLAFKAFNAKLKDIGGKVKLFWKNIDLRSASIMKNIQRALTSDRREAIIKGSILPSMSQCIKALIVIAGTTAVGAFFNAPYIGVIAAIGMLGASKYLNERERNLIYDEIETELKVLEKEIELAVNDGDMKKYRFLLNYQKKLQREKMRIKYGTLLKGKPIPLEGRS